MHLIGDMDELHDGTSDTVGPPPKITLAPSSALSRTITLTSLRGGGGMGHLGGVGKF